MLFGGWESVGRIVAQGAGAYVALVVLLRLTGKRTLSKMNAFDLVVTVALGSTLATVLTSSQLPLVDGVIALATLVLLQYAVAWASTRSPWFNSVVKSQPRVLFHRGAFSREALRDERITEDEVRAAIRQASVASVDEVESVVLESSGEIAVVKAPPRRGAGDHPGDVHRGVRFDPGLEERRDGGAGTH